MESSISKLQKKYFAFVPLINLISKRGFHKNKKALKILNTTQKKFNLIMSGDYGSLEIDEMVKWTVTIIMHYRKKAKKK
jgi:hypothetical protein